MILQVDGKNYRVNWIHLEGTYPHIGTICLITNLDNDITIEGYSYVSKKDSYNYDKGRKVSLSRALSKIFPLSDDKVINSVIKDKRKEFWKEYFKMTHKDFIDEKSVQHSENG